MKTTRNPTTILTAFAAIFLGLWACTMSDDARVGGGGGGGGGGDTTGLVLTVTDSTQVDLDFNNLADTVFTDSQDFDLANVRKEIDDQGINLSTVSIRSVSASFDDSTRAFLVANQGLPYVVKFYVDNPNDGVARQVALESQPYPPLTLDTADVVLEKNQDLWAGTGFAQLMSAVRDTLQSSIRVTAELIMKSPLQDTGSLRVNFIVTVQGKAKI